MPSEFEFDEPEERHRQDRLDRPSSDNWFLDFLAFRRMAVPIITQIVFWIGIIAIIGGVFYAISETSNPRIRAGAVLGSLLLMLLWRVLCEQAILFFRMNETMTMMYHELRRSNRRK